MALTDIYQLIHKQTYLNEQVENVYFYLRDSSAIDHQDLQDAFVANMLPSIQAVQCPQIITTTIRAMSLGNLSDFGESIVNSGGTYDPSEMLPIFNALSYTLRSANRAVRPGSKRIAGIPETAQVDGQITLSAYITRMETLRVAMDTALTATGGFFTPVIVKRIKTAIPDTMPVKYQYSLPAGSDTPVTATLLGVFVSKKVSHQVSRGNS